MILDPQGVLNRMAELKDEADMMGKWKTAAVGLDHRRKQVRARLFNECSGPATVRMSLAEAHPDYAEVCAEHAAAEGEYVRIKARYDLGMQGISYAQTLARLERVQ